jgi:hypothetical protein
MATEVANGSYVRRRFLVTRLRTVRVRFMHGLGDLAWIQSSGTTLTGEVGAEQHVDRASIRRSPSASRGFVFIVCCSLWHATVARPLGDSSRQVWARDPWKTRTAMMLVPVFGSWDYTLPCSNAALRLQHRVAISSAAILPNG